VGHLVAGETDTGLTLLAAEGVGAGLILGGFGGLALTGAAHQWVAPFIGTAGLGVGLFVGSLLADVYGVLAPPGGFGAAPTRLPAFTLHLGSRHLVDPARGVGGVFVTGGRLVWGRAALRSTLWRAQGGEDQRVELGAAYRIWGPPPTRSGRFVELEAAVVHHRDDPGRFSIDTAELSVAGRLELADVAPTLAGAYASGALGMAVGYTDYDDIGKEATEMTLMRLAFGVYLGRRDPPWGEFTLFYDHRHDGYVAGMKQHGIGSGPLGHVGAGLHLRVHGPWGLRLEVAAGSTVMSGLSLTWEGAR
jgi:hypothetical protein